MGWMAARADERGSPRVLWSETRSILMLGMNYGPDIDPLAATARRERGAISVYAQGRDYHEVLKGRLKLLAGFMLARAGGGAVKVFVDTAPVMEKPLAEAAGLGWQGKHTNLVSREFGSWLFLGAIFTDLELAPDVRELDRCGSCHACLDVCPTGAFPAPYRLDARRCISYLTIEHSGPIPEEFRAAIGNRIYGCDDCLAVCPWNKFAQTIARGEICGQGEPALAGRSRSWRASTMRRSASFSPARPSSASVLHASCAMWRSRSATAATRLWQPRWPLCSAQPRPWFAAPRSGRWGGFSRKRRFRDLLNRS